MKVMGKYLAVLLAIAVLAGCDRRAGSGKGGSDTGADGTPSATGEVAKEGDKASGAAGHEPAKAFPVVSVPMVYADDENASVLYVMEHYWDSFLSSDSATTAGVILGVKDNDVEQALANYIALLENHKRFATPEEPAACREAVKSVGTFFKKLEKKQQADTTALTYLRLTEMVSRYLYDPNSPLRDEDLYLPFAEAAAESPCTSDDMRTAYRFEASQCRLNGFGQKVPDIRYCLASGKKSNLYSVNAEYTMLFFSNPGCNACKEIMHEVMSRRYVGDYIADGRLAIVNVYIDHEIDAWRDYVHNYPANWINGYDYTFRLRDSGEYDIRAIPSLYLLDSQKRVLMKDAPTDKVLSFLDKI